MPVLTALIVLAGLLAAIKIYNLWTSGKCSSQRDMTGKVVVITGGNTGIGKATVRDLARRNARVIMGCRELTRARQAVNEIRRETGNAQVSVLELDLASLHSIRHFNVELRKAVKRVDVLINNAAVGGLPNRKLTKDNLEVTFAVNYFGPFYLTHLLLDLLIKSSPSRIVNVSSLAHRIFTHLRLDNLNSEKQFQMYTVYGNSKLALTIFTKMLAEKLKGMGVTVNCLHPGAVNTDLFRKMPEWMRRFTKITLQLFYKSPEEGAQTSIHLAVSEEVEHVSGKYFSECAIAAVHRQVNDEELGRKLWNTTEKILEIKTFGKAALSS